MTQNRDRSLDIAKGIAIIMIVAGHCLRGLSSAGLIAPRDSAQAEADIFLYMCHLAVFTLLAGAFVTRSVQKRGRRAYLLQRTIDFVWVYTIWTVIQGLVKVATASLVNTPISYSDIPRQFILPDSQMWYIPFLLCVTYLVVLAQPWLPTRRVPCLAAASVISLGTWGHDGGVVGLQGWPLLIFFVAGVVAGAQRILRTLNSIPNSVGLILGFGGLALLMMIWNPEPPTVFFTRITVDSVSLGALATCLGVTGVLYASRLLAMTPASRPMAFIGRHSMEIFLAHITAGSGVRIVLVKLGMTNVGLHIVVGIVCGVAFPLILWWAIRFIPIGWLFTPPPALASRVTGRASASPVEA